MAIWLFRRREVESGALLPWLRRIEEELRALKDAIRRGEEAKLLLLEEVRAFSEKLEEQRKTLEAVNEGVSRLARQAYTRAQKELAAFEDLRQLEAKWRELAEAWQKERGEERQREEFLRSLLPLKDAFGAARRTLEGDVSLRLVLDPLEERLDLVLRGLGAEETARTLERFRPSEQVAVHVVADASPEGTVLAVLRQGYRLDGRLIRPAEVRVSGGPGWIPAAGASPPTDRGADLEQNLRAADDAAWCEGEGGDLA